MKRLYTTHFLSKSFAISLSLLCWIAVLFNFSAGHTNSSAQAVTAFSTSSVNCPDYSPEIKMINKNTYELSYNNTFDILKQYDKNLSLISSYTAGNYTDYYFYSPKLCNEKNITPVSNGFNIHLDITKYGKVYLGLPYIDYDF